MREKKKLHVRLGLPPRGTKSTFWLGDRYLEETNILAKEGHAQVRDRKKLHFWPGTNILLVGNNRIRLLVGVVAVWRDKIKLHLWLGTNICWSAKTKSTFWLGNKHFEETNFWLGDRHFEETNILAGVSQRGIHAI